VSDEAHSVERHLRVDAEGARLNGLVFDRMAERMGEVECFWRRGLSAVTCALRAS
jgi:hypothetical protein